MSLQYQLSDARADLGLREVSTVCHDSDKFRYQIDTVIRQLMKRGAWFGTEVLARFCIYGCDLVLPRHVETVLGAKPCNGMIDIKNNWYSIVGGMFDCSDLWGPGVLIENGTTPCFSSVSGTSGKRIAYHVVHNDDVGKKVKVYGKFYGGQPIQEKVNGVWEDGITITAQQAGGNSLPAMTPAESLISEITHVVKDATSGMSYLYEYGEDANAVFALRMLGAYEPNETNPMYRRMKLKNINSIPAKTDEYGRTVRSIDLMVKLRHTKLVNDYDFLLVDDFDALRYGVQALRADEAGNPELAEAFWTKAIRELNFGDRSKTPGQNISVRVRVTGSNRQIVNPI